MSEEKLLNLNPEATKDFTHDELEKCEEWLSECNEILVKKLKEDEEKVIDKLLNHDV